MGLQKTNRTPVDEDNLYFVIIAPIIYIGLFLYFADVYIPLYIITALLIFTEVCVHLFYIQEIDYTHSLIRFVMTLLVVFIVHIVFFKIVESNNSNFINYLYEY